MSATTTSLVEEETIEFGTNFKNENYYEVVVPHCSLI